MIETTQVLTKSGWINIPDIILGVHLVVLTDHKYIKYKPTKSILRPNASQLFRINSNSINLVGNFSVVATNDFDIPYAYKSIRAMHNEDNVNYAFKAGGVIERVDYDILRKTGFSLYNWAHIINAVASSTQLQPLPRITRKLNTAQSKELLSIIDTSKFTDDSVSELILRAGCIKVNNSVLAQDNILVNSNDIELIECNPIPTYWIKMNFPFLCRANSSSTPIWVYQN